MRSRQELATSFLKRDCMRDTSIFDRAKKLSASSSKFETLKRGILKVRLEFYCLCSSFSVSSHTLWVVNDSNCPFVFFHPSFVRDNDTRHIKKDCLRVWFLRKNQNFILNFFVPTFFSFSLHQILILLFGLSYVVWMNLAWQHFKRNTIAVS